MRPSDRAWIVLGAGVVAWDTSCGDGNTLSEAADAYLLSHPWLTRAVVAAVALHLTNAVPQTLDPIHWLFLAARGVRRVT